MRTLVTAAVVALLLTGCLKGDDRKVAIRDNLIRLQASIDGGINQMGLSEMLTNIDTATRIALADGQIDETMAAEVALVVAHGRHVGQAWKARFGCRDSDDYLPKKCLPTVMSTLQSLGLTDTEIKELQAAEDAYVARSKERGYDPSFADLAPDEAVRIALSLLDKRAAETVANLKKQKH